MSASSNPSPYSSYPALATCLEDCDHRKRRKARDSTKRIFRIPRATAANHRNNSPRPRKPPAGRRFPVIPQVRGRFPQDAPQTNTVLNSDATAGLGILTAPMDPPPYSSKPSTHEKNDSALNIAQWIEKRLWRHDSSKNERWLVEITSWVISLLCMSAFLAIILSVKDKKQPGWPLALILSILSRVVASGALVLPTSEALGRLKWNWFQDGSKKLWDFEIFDNASRGATGSFMLLIRTKGRNLAALGAAVTLLALALDPFFQQVTSFPERLIPQGNGAIPRVIRHESHDNTVTSYGVKQVMQDQDTYSTAYKFFFGNGTQSMPFGIGTRADIPLSCPTTNCTWPPYQSLGVCSACKDISQLLTYACITTQIDWSEKSATGFGAESKWPNGTACGYFLNVTNGPILMSGYRVNSANQSVGNQSVGEALITRSMPLVGNLMREQLFGGSINFRDVRNPINDFLIVGTADAASVYRNETPVAHECMLTWCVKTFKSSYNWASYTEEVTDTFINTTAGPFPWLVEEANGVVNSFYLQNITVDPPFNIHDDPLDYGVSNATALSTNINFDDIFSAFTTAANSSADPILKFQTQFRTPMFRTPEFNPWLAPNNITAHLERLATALTNDMRSFSTDMVTGTAFGKETYVAVSCAWLTLPFALLVLSGIFLLATIIKSSGNDDVGVRKTSAIATLLYGLPNDMQKELRATTSPSVGTPKMKAMGLKVNLLPNRHGWRISGNPILSGRSNVRRNEPPPGWI